MATPRKPKHRGYTPQTVYRTGSVLVTLDDGVTKKLDAVAKKIETKRSEVIRLILRAAIKKGVEKEVVKQFALAS